MAETPSTLSPPLASPQSVSGLDSPQYWCYHCDKRVAVETLPDLPDVICSDCKNGFVESISAAALPTPASSGDPSLGNQFIQVLRLIAQAAREEDAPPPLPSDPSDEDYLRIEPDGWGNENDDDENEVNRAVEVFHEEDDATDYRSDGEEEDGINVVEPSEAEDDDEDEDEDEDENENEDEARQTRRDILSGGIQSWTGLIS
ncbi:zinc finger protein [Striga asiatica]|uniref:RING-type E3 ubiquitin transferase n=1 Tax=Striga asiatica TaxID=4170 RepID=A0A5A7QHD4_STRAF|nr:zinc finger protein [Striga asiatica]